MPRTLPGASAWEARAKRLRLMGLGIFLTSLAAASWLYVRAEARFVVPAGYEVIDGVAYPVPVEDMKAYDRQMELYGGKGLVLVEALDRWFVGLGRSKALAAMVAALGAGAALAFFRAARRSPEEEAGDDSP